MNSYPMCTLVDIEYKDAMLSRLCSKHKKVYTYWKGLVVLILFPVIGNINEREKRLYLKSLNGDNVIVC